MKLKIPMDSKTIARRKTVMESLTEQLKSGVKPNKDATTKEKKEGKDKIPLSEKDIKRIENEISVLKTRM